MKKQTTKPKTPIERTNKESEAILKELKVKSKELSNFCVKNNIPLFLSTVVEVGKYNGGITAINGHPIKIAHSLCKALDEAPMLKALVAMHTVLATSKKPI